MSLFLIIEISKAVVLFFGALILRIYPHLRHKPGGVDTWFYLFYIEQLKKEKKFPVKLDYFLMEEKEQWYPPAFPIFLSFIPHKLLYRYHWLVSPLVDCLQLLILYFFTLLMTRSSNTALLAGLIYAAAPTLYLENRNLNSRSFGALWHTLAMISVIYFSNFPTTWSLVSIVIFGYLVLMSHKLTAQALFFNLLFFALIKVDWIYLAFMGGILLTTFVLSFGFYYKVLLAHLDILKFWKRHLVNLRAHQILDSPVYGVTGDYSRKFFKPGFKGVAEIGARLFVYNPFLCLIPLIFMCGFPLDDYFLWAFAILFFTFLTAYFKPVRFLGEGFKYLKLGIFPIAYISAGYFFTYESNLFNYSVILLIVLSFAVDIFLYSYTTRQRDESVTSTITPDLMEMINVIAKSPGKRVLCLPVIISEVVAYHTRKKVLWGGHGYGFKMLEGFFPVLEKPLERFLHRYKIDYLLLDKLYIQIDVFKWEEKSIKKRFENGRYQLFAVER